MGLSDPCCSRARGSHSLSHVHSPYQSLGRHSLGGDGRRAWEHKDSEKRIAGDEVRRVNASGKRDCVSSKVHNSLNVMRMRHA